MCFLSADAQKKIPDTHRTCNLPKYTRTDIILPVVKGYNCYKADLHVHTIFSDGNLSPDERVDEAWQDGLDILAITDHIETRRQERDMLKFLKGFTGGEAKKAINANVIRKSATEEGILADLNLPVKLAQNAAKAYIHFHSAKAHS